ncbi:ATP-dependent RNA helicase SrmB [Idiomarina aquatica]|uniref:ATP-dependent RNA helicase SrmB n=1 Tax=Idiomarina aquatica TaxID=1327752 RepID=A0A4V3CPS9_9GAMM|nr:MULTISPECIES: ATP-dependent RNA helicase SrmB [Idiomarina]MAK72394.1 ATP-dependent RNA helicase SrmB [Idiomarinaceae bacterium]TDP39215.1 ATP-dependent RNA helicase SrmB [Idiomarina aquatica]HAD49257.1 ATP-dependent RNA helicase SrmB [Idiomarina sp.]
MAIDWQDLELDESLIFPLLEQGLNKPAKVQQEVIPTALDGMDVLLSSPTGSGKTLAFLLPALQHLRDFPRKSPGGARILVLAPTRELAEQIYQQACLFSKSSGLSAVVVTGGINYGSQLSQLEKSHDLLIATPGRLLDILQAEQYQLETVEWLVIDEADRMLDMGFAKPVEEIARHARHRQQSILSSATLASAGVESFAKKLLNEPVRIEVEPPKRERGKILQYVYLADTLEHKQNLLLRVLKEFEGRQIVFVKTRDKVAQLAGTLQANLSYPVLHLRGDLPQAERQRIIEQFKAHPKAVLVATDVASRGLDIDDVSVVVNFDLPKQADTYVHRIGRTARAGAKGVAISLVEAHDALLLGRIERYTGQALDRRVFSDLKPQHKFPATDKKRSKKKKTAKKNKKR